MLRDYAKRIPGAVEVVRFAQHPRETAARWRALAEFRREHSAAFAYVPPDAGRRGTMLIVNPIGDWVTAVLQEGFFIKAAQLAGYDIAVVTNRGAWANRYHRLFGVRRFLDLDDVVARARQMVDPHVAPSLLAGVRTFHDLLRLEYRGVHVGQLVASMFVRRRYVGDVACEDPAVRQAIMDPLQASLVTVHAAETVFDSIRPHVALFNERTYSPYGEFFSTAIRRGVPVVQWCGSHRESAFMLKRYHAGNIGDHPASLSNATWAMLERMPWNSTFGTHVREELGEQYGTGQWFSEVGTQFLAQETDPGRVKEILRLDPSKKIAVVFSHMFWDATFFYGDDLFTNYREWFMETVRAACANDRVQWIFKLHPANVVKLTRDGYHGELVERQAIRDAVGVLPPHVHVLDPDVPLSTWSLLAAVDYAVTVRGTVGIEAALFGIPVLTAGTGRFDRHGFTVDSVSRAEYLDRLAHIEDTPRLTLEQVERAEKFAYGIFCLRPCRVSSIQYGHRRDAVATLDVTYHVRTPDELQRAEDLAAVGEWMCGDAEDFLDPEHAAGFQPFVAAAATSPIPPTQRESPTASRSIAWTPEQVVRFWDHESQFPEHYFTNQFGPEIVRALRPYLRGRRRVLDYGCGTGDLIPHLLTDGYEVTGMEPSLQSRAAAQVVAGSRERFHGIYDLVELQRRGDRFDAILVIEVVEHLDDTALVELLATVRGLLAPQGVVIFTTPHNEDLAVSSIRCPNCATTFHRWQHVRSWTPELLRATMIRNRFFPVSCSPTNFAVSWRLSRGQYLAYHVRRALRRSIPSPHLICVCSSEDGHR